MARSIGMLGDGAVFRLWLKLKYPGSEPFIKYEGPYETIGAARNRKSYWINRLGEFQEGTEQDSYAKVNIHQGFTDWTFAE